MYIDKTSFVAATTAILLSKIKELVFFLPDLILERGLLKVAVETL